MQKQLKPNNNQNFRAFSLVELAFTIILVGVLASLAFPQYLKSINITMGTEAVNQLGVIKRAIDACVLMTASYFRCTDLNALEIDNPNNKADTNFTYEISANQRYISYIMAKRKINEYETETDEFGCTGTTTLTKGGEIMLYAVGSTDADRRLVRCARGSFANLDSGDAACPGAFSSIDGFFTYGL